MMNIFHCNRASKTLPDLERQDPKTAKEGEEQDHATTQEGIKQDQEHAILQGRQDYGVKDSNLLFYYDIKFNAQDILDASVIESYTNPNVTRKMAQAYGQFAKDLLDDLVQIISLHESWEVDTLCELVQFKNRSFTYAPPPPPPMEIWISELDALRRDLDQSLKNMEEEFKMLNMPCLTTSHKRAIENLTHLLHDWIEERTVYYANHLAGVSHIVKIRSEYTFTRLRQIRELIANSPVKGEDAFIIPFAYICIFQPDLDNIDIHLYIIFGTLVFLFALHVLSWSSGQFVYWLCSFFSPRKEIYEIASKALNVARSDWPSLQFGPDPSWGSGYCWWKRVRRTEWDPWAQNAKAAHVVNIRSWIDVPLPSITHDS
ncbi:hypothetical protein PUMCH_003989 [Australozyma saopauloensis]|uniref:Uncharacterized protein n=1 Tax=Australozyma saopauloensis TaxID=291208 RepID=A0AAX4HDY2_9ASCO|nr:hypothetical protein PUMCH_003989 [[Candida] saopauloensis]